MKRKTKEEQKREQEKAQQKTTKQLERINENKNKGRTKKGEAERRSAIKESNKSQPRTIKIIKTNLKQTKASKNDNHRKETRQ